MATETKGITVKVDKDLHAEATEYAANNNLKMPELITKALQNLLHPPIDQKEEKYMGKLRTVAFQAPEEVFDKLNDYLSRNKLKKNKFFLDFINKTLEEDQVMREGKIEQKEVSEEQEEPTPYEEVINTSDEQNEDEQTEKYDEEESEEFTEDEGEPSEDEDLSEDEEDYQSVGLSMGM